MSTALGSSPEIGSLLSQVRTLETDRERLNKELEELKRRLEEEQRKFDAAQQKMGKLTESKRNEMQQSFDNVIKKWLEDIVQDESVRKQFESGVTRLVQDTEEENGIWQVVCCASNRHLKDMQEIEQLKDRINTMEQGKTPEFANTEARKRTREEEPPKHTGGDIWQDFSAYMQSNGVIPPI